jgi:single-stranded-DNA-specific exonuclease
MNAIPGNIEKSSSYIESNYTGVVHKRIKIKSFDSGTLSEIASKLKLQNVTAKILSARGFKVDKTLEDYIEPTLSKGLPNPDDLVGLDKAVKIIIETLNGNESIAIACDFDVDGLSGGAQAYDFFNSIGLKSKVFVPDRFEDGYGLNEKIVRTAHSEGYKVLLTIDYGTTNIKEIQLAKELGMKTIVVDHHHVAEIRSQPDAFINPNQDGCGFAGKIMSAAGLVWYLIIGVNKSLEANKKIDPKNYLDLACLGTICDMVPLLGVNRIIAKKGLEQVTQTKRTGLNALKNIAGIKSKVNCHDIGFAIGPRINAAGRMLNGSVVIDLLTTDNSDLSDKLAGKLNRLNSDRQDTENLVKEKAIEQIKKRGILESALIVWDKDFHTGVVGIVAQRLVEIFYRPSVVLGVDNDGIYKGSVRGIKGFHVAESLAAVGDCLIKHGGHSGAGGLSVKPEKLSEFVERYKEYCQKILKTIETIPYIECDAEVILDELDLSLCEELQNFSPFGLGNPTPVLFSRGLKVLEVILLKKAHLKVILSDGSKHLSCLMWRTTSHPALKVGSIVNIAYKLDKNTFNGRTDIQATLQAVELG